MRKSLLILLLTIVCSSCTVAAYRVGVHTNNLNVVVCKPSVYVYCY